MTFPTPEAAQDAFYAAFAATDLGAMAEVWGEDSLCIHPGGGPLKDKAAVMQSWMEIFSAAQPPSIEVEPVVGMTSGDLAVRVLVELIRPNGRPTEAASRVWRPMSSGSWTAPGASWNTTPPSRFGCSRSRVTRTTGCINPREAQWSVVRPCLRCARRARRRRVPARCFSR
jgi:ketosteroid isomerase-like protein